MAASVEPDVSPDSPQIPEDERMMLLLAIDEILDGNPGQAVQALINYYLDMPNQGRATDMASYQATARLLMLVRALRDSRLAWHGKQSKPNKAPPPQVTYRALFTKPGPHAPGGVAESSQSAVWHHPAKADVTWKWTINGPSLQAIQKLSPGEGVGVLCQRFTGKTYDGGWMTKVTGSVAEIFTGPTLHAFGLGLESQWEKGRCLITLLDDTGRPVTSPAP